MFFKKESCPTWESTGETTERVLCISWRISHRTCRVLSNQKTPGVYPLGKLTHLVTGRKISQPFFTAPNGPQGIPFEKHSASRFSKFKSILSDLAPELDGVRTDLSLCLKTINQPFMICMFAHVHVCAYVCTYV